MTDMLTEMMASKKLTQEELGSLGAFIINYPHLSKCSGLTSESITDMTAAELQDRLRTAIESTLDSVPVVESLLWAEEMLGKYSVHNHGDDSDENSGQDESSSSEDDASGES